MQLSALMQTTLTWHPATICLRPLAIDLPALADEVYRLTCRTSLGAPGFCIVNLGSNLTSSAFRSLMVGLKQEMTLIHATRTHETLIYLSAARFDQQETTRPHLDGGPAECFLMLGYEPSEIESELEIFDYSKCAKDLGLSPQEFLARHNPMFTPGHELLKPYGTRIPCFDNGSFQIVCINNSFAGFTADSSSWLGTLHTATIFKADESQRRVINSTMIARAPMGTEDVVDEASIATFTRTTEVRRRGYDKRHLEDDAE